MQVPYPLVPFVRVCVFATLLCAGGALFGDMIVRKRVKMNTALVASFTSVLGVMVGVAQLWQIA
ncbi:hypothetical protein GCM10009712_40800 [Pseudarthrobacter sulfonivorans]